MKPTGRTRAARLALAAIATGGVLSAALPVPAPAQTPPRPAARPAEKPPAPPPELPAPSYEADLLRLGEVMGALSVLRDVCGHDDGPEWTQRMRELLDSEAPSGMRRERLAGRFNAAVEAYRTSHRNCTAGSRAAMERFLQEGAKLARSIAGRFGG